MIAGFTPYTVSGTLSSVAGKAVTLSSYGTSNIVFYLGNLRLHSLHLSFDGALGETSEESAEFMLFHGTRPNPSNDNTAVATAICASNDAATYKPYLYVIPSMALVSISGILKSFVVPFRTGSDLSFDPPIVASTIGGFGMRQFIGVTTSNATSRVLTFTFEFDFIPNLLS